MPSKGKQGHPSVSTQRGDGWMTGFVVDQMRGSPDGSTDQIGNGDLAEHVTRALGNIFTGLLQHALGPAFAGDVILPGYFAFDRAFNGLDDLLERDLAGSSAKRKAAGGAPLAG